jgi:uncharacterized protein YPO0396
MQWLSGWMIRMMRLSSNLSLNLLQKERAEPSTKTVGSLNRVNVSYLLIDPDTGPRSPSCATRMGSNVKTSASHSR